MNDLWARVIELERRKRKASSQLDLLSQQLAELQSRRNQQALGPYYPGTGSPEIVLEYVKRIEVRLKLGYFYQYQWAEPTTANFIPDYPGNSLETFAQSYLFDWQYADTLVDDTKTFRRYVRTFNFPSLIANSSNYFYSFGCDLFYNLQDKKSYFRFTIRFYRAIVAQNKLYQFWKTPPDEFDLKSSVHPIINSTGEIDIPIQFVVSNGNTDNPGSAYVHPGDDPPFTIFDGIVSIRWGSLGTIPDTGGTPAGTGDKLLIQSSGGWNSLGTGELTDGGTF